MNNRNLKTYESNANRIKSYKQKIEEAKARLKELNSSNVMDANWAKNLSEINNLEGNIHQYKAIIRNIEQGKPSHGAPLSYQQDITNRSIKR